MIINAGIQEVVIQRAAGFRWVEVEEWVRTNLGEVRKVEGRLVPVRTEKY